MFPLLPVSYFASSEGNQKTDPVLLAKRLKKSAPSIEKVALASASLSNWLVAELEKKGLKKATVALGRKVSVIMHRMLITREKFKFGEEVKAA